MRSLVHEIVLIGILFTLSVYTLHDHIALPYVSHCKMDTFYMEYVRSYQVLYIFCVSALDETPLFNNRQIRVVHLCESKGELGAHIEIDTLTSKRNEFTSP